jgi:cytochrome c oxidase subunit 3/cytochrome o ubiquinol oxidase subunit 3
MATVDQIATEVSPAAIEARMAPAKVGMACFILSEAIFFSTLIIAYLTYLGVPQEGPTPRQVLDLTIPIIGTICLLSSSLTIGFSVSSLERGKQMAAALFLGITAALGAGFLIGTGIEWATLINRHHLTIGRNSFGTTYFTLIGFHGLHVSIGVVIMSVVAWAIATRRILSQHAIGVELFSWYWHFVDIVWVALFLIVYLLGR